MLRSARPLSILIANRGEIALRVNKTAALSGIKTTTVYTDPDRHAQHALSSLFALNLGASTEYLNGKKIISLAKANNCSAIHPGYGFLSENSTFAKDCVEAGITFIGPPWQAIEAMGNKSRSKEIMTAAGVPCIPGYHGGNQDPDFLLSQARDIGFPVLLKAVKGGGGKGMRIADEHNFYDQLTSAKNEAKSSFNDDVMLVEKYIQVPRHIEVQIFADKYGNCVALGERDCSIQRRHQKILEESPAPNLDEAVRQDLYAKARAAATAVQYEGAGTVEFIFDNETGNFFFMEMNTRLQVEHPVTEMVTGTDLVQWQITVAQGKELPLNQARVNVDGHAIEARIYAENPDLDFMPDSGRITHLKAPTPSDTVRIDAGFVEGDEVSAHYDPMIAKLIVHGRTREEALSKMHAALEEYEVAGVATNIEFLKRIVRDDDFCMGRVETGYIKKHPFEGEVIPAEVYVQAALALSKSSSSSLSRLYPFDVPVHIHGNQIHLPTLSQTYTVETSYDPRTKTTTTFFPHTRLDSRVIDGDEISVFQQGRHYKLKLPTPAWTESVDTNINSVLTPMPCKIHSVAVSAGDHVTKDQVLVVIESMKMETAIRSPHDGIIRRVVHSAGDMCKAGTALVEFE